MSLSCCRFSGIRGLSRDYQSLLFLLRQVIAVSLFHLKIMIVTLKWREEVRVDREVFSKHNVMVIAKIKVDQ